MRYLFVFLLCLMVLFMGVQYNDPDGLMWMMIYAVPALWCAVAAFWQRAFDYGLTRWGLVCSIAAASAGVLWFWPLTPQFWTKNVWYNVETAREGMGLMIIAGILLLVYVGRARASSKPMVSVGKLPGKLG